MRRDRTPTSIVAVAAGGAMLLLALAIQSGGALSAQGRTVWDGVFSAEQAARGKEAFDTYCAACHGFQLEGVAGQRQLAGDTFRIKWDAASANELFTKVSTTMPQTSPGALDGPLYTDIIAYIFESNGYPAGSDELMPESNALAAIQIAGRDGPLPADTGSLIRVVGCLTRGAGDDLVITNSVGPIRTRNMSASEGPELITAENTAAGAESVTIQGFFSPDPAEHIGSRVEAKGLMISRPDGNRIRLTSLLPLGDTCPS